MSKVSASRGFLADVNMHQLDVRLVRMHVGRVEAWFWSCVLPQGCVLEPVVKSGVCKSSKWVFGEYTGLALLILLDCLRCGAIVVAKKR